MKHLTKRQIILVFSISLLLVPVVAAPLFEVESVDESLSLSDGFRSQKYSPFNVDLGIFDQMDVSVFRLKSVAISESLTFSSFFKSQSFDFTGLDLFEGVALSDSLRIIPSPILYETLDLVSLLDFSYLRFYSVALSVITDIQDGFKQILNPRFYEDSSVLEGFKAYLNPVLSDVISFLDNVVSQFIPKVKDRKDHSKIDVVPKQRETSDDVEDLDISDSVMVSVTRAYRVDVGDSIEVDDSMGGEDVDGLSISIILGAAFLLTAILAVGINLVLNKI